MTTNAADGAPVDDQAQNPAGDNPNPENPGQGQEGETPKAPEPGSLAELIAGLDDRSQTKILAEVRSARREAASLRARLNEAEPKVLTAEEKATAAQRTAEERVAALQRTVVRSKVEALASTGFQNPADAERFLESLDDYLGPDGEVDEAALRSDLALVLKERPYLAKTDGRRGPRPDPFQASGANRVPDADPAAAFQSFITGQLTGR